MAHTVESRADSPANQLRDALDRAERLVVTVDRHTVEELLVLLDAIRQSFIDLSGDGVDLRPEDVRWRSILNRLMSRPGPIVNAAAAAGGYAPLRAKHPPAEDIWWHLDSFVAQRRRKAALRLVTTIVAIVAGAAILYYAINTLFPPDPAAVMMVDATSSISQLIQQERWDDALAVVDEALTELPNEPELLIWRTVLLEHLGRADEAEEALQKAQDVYPARAALFWTVLGNTRFQAADLDGAEAAGQKAIELDPDEPQAYLLLGGLAEMRGDMNTAIEMFEKTVALAEETSPELVVIAKVRLAQALQRPNLPTPPAGEPLTPAP
jgi:tetratricopeptide (TPR) repeat protein